jgi:ribonuclease D
MTLPAPKHYSREWVDNPASLSRAVAAVEKAERVYFDLEADSMHHYYAKICLMQVLADKTCYAIDPLAGLDLKPLLAALALKPLVLHGADYDLRMLYQQYGFRPKEIFDTMIAAQLLSRTSFGLAALVKEFFGITLGKEAQKADWSRRPLPESMLEYAVQDTFFLPDLHQALLSELKAQGRLEWHQESCQALIRATERIRETDPDAAWRLVGSAKYAPRQLAALKAQWDVRENLAKSKDIPAYKILPSEILLRFAENVPREGRPEQIPRLPSRLEPAVEEAFIRAFNEAIQSDPKGWPQPIPPPRKPVKSPHPDLLAELRKIRDGIATGLKLDPSLLAPRAVLLAVAITGLYSPQEVREAAGWMHWQEKLLLEPWLVAAQRYHKPR